jgi:lipoprotein-releasing system permease protein
VSFLGIVLGVIALVVVVSVMNGFDRELKQRILGVVPHLTVSDISPIHMSEVLNDYPVKALSAFQETQLLLLTERGSHLLAVYGIEPESEKNASTLAESVASGKLIDLMDSSLAIMLGGSAARRFGLSIGDNVSLVVPVISANGQIVKPRVFPARLVGTFSLRSELDHRLGVIHLNNLLKITHQKQALRITLENVFLAPIIEQKLIEKGYAVTSWTKNFGDFFQTVKMEKVMMFVLLSFVVAIASFSIVSGITMMVATKRRDIAVLRTMGLSEWGVFKIFLFQGVGIGVSGVCVGLVLGVPIAFYIAEIMSLIDALIGFSIVEGTYFSEIPSDVRLLDILVITLVSLIISLIATLVPSYRASKLHPAEMLKYE